VRRARLRIRAVLQDGASGLRSRRDALPRGTSTGDASVPARVAGQDRHVRQELHAGHGLHRRGALERVLLRERHFAEGLREAILRRFRAELRWAARVRLLLRSRVRRGWLRGHRARDRACSVLPGSLHGRRTAAALERSRRHTIRLATIEHWPVTFACPYGRGISAARFPTHLSLPPSARGRYDISCASRVRSCREGGATD